MTVDVSTLARSSRLRLPAGGALETPLLIPSFSSRGFPFEGPEGNRRSSIAGALEVAQEWIADVLLISAYDLHHGHMPFIDSLATYPAGEPIGAPELLLLDSGCYEAQERLELPEARLSAIEVREWNLEMLASVVDSCNSDLSVALVNYDHVGDIDEQITLAESFFSRRPRFLHDLLLKPTSRDNQFIDVDGIIGRAGRLGSFNLVGFTEKELGNSILERLAAIARIRSALDEVGVRAPIHVFGSLDPVLSPLYFLAGAEVFDGLSWLYLTYYQGIASSTEAASALSEGWAFDQVRRRSVQMFDNLRALSELSLAMRRFLSDREFEVFRYHQATYRAGYEHLRAKVTRAR